VPAASGGCLPRGGVPRIQVDDLLRHCRHRGAQDSPAVPDPVLPVGFAYAVVAALEQHTFVRQRLTAPY
jgi:hypothetical protein